MKSKEMFWAKLFFQSIRTLKRLFHQREKHNNFVTFLLSKLNDHLDSVKSQESAFLKLNKINLLHEGNNSDFKRRCEVHLNQRELSWEDCVFLGHEYTNSIGHMSIGLSTRLRLRQRNIRLNDDVVIYSKTANEHLLKNYFSKFYKIYKVSDMTYEILRRIETQKFEEISYFGTSIGAIPLYEALDLVSRNDLNDALLGKSQSNHVFTLTLDDQAFLSSTWIKWGLRKAQDYVVLHLKRENSSKGLRGADFTSYIPVIDYILSTGRAVVYFGDDRKGVQYFESRHGFIDYHQMSDRNERRDISLLAGCSVAIVTTSGPMNVPALFGVPIIWTNAIGFSRYVKLDSCVFLPKLFYEDDRLVTLSEMLKEPELFFVDELDSKKEKTFIDRRIRIRNNSATEILKAYQELESFDFSLPLMQQPTDLKSILSSSTSTLSHSFLQKHHFWVSENQ